MPGPAPQPSPAPARLLWDAGGLWSLMTWEACRARGLAIEPISAAEVAAGGLAGCGLLVVPGGWPALKRRALGERGRAALRAFVSAGGLYLGMCGGAGLALGEADGIGLTGLGRSRGARRLPALSGRVLVEPTLAGAEHPLLAGAGERPALHVWWPGQFAPTAGHPEITVLARYHGPGPDLFSADLRAPAVDPQGWPGLEAQYGLNLDPDALWGQPAVVEARLGWGRAILSYLHFDTPGDPAGADALARLWAARLGQAPGRPRPWQPLPAGTVCDHARALWERGRELGLWRPRHPAMPLWRRGARGLEFWSLLRLCGAVQALAGPGGPPPELGLALEPVWRDGPSVLGAMAAALAGYGPGERGAAPLERWFPAPRRTGGELAAALAGLERGLLELIRADCD